MSYSHYLAYFSHHRGEIEFMRFIADVRTIVENAPDGADLCGKKAGSAPVINDRMLIIGSNASQSPFSRLKISLDQPWPAHRYPLTTIDTDRLPYDSTICACLLAFKHHFPAADITSNGTTKDWANPIALYEFSTDRPAPELALEKG